MIIAGWPLSAASAIFTELGPMEEFQAFPRLPSHRTFQHIARVNIYERGKMGIVVHAIVGRCNLFEHVMINAGGQLLHQFPVPGGQANEFSWSMVW